MEKITRAAFLYMEPPPGYYKPEKFAQCETCRKYIPLVDKCIELGPEVNTPKGKSCGLYSPWPLGKPDFKVIKNHFVELKQVEKKDAKVFVTPEQAGLVNRQVRCENCYYFNKDESDCELFETLNKALPQCFDLNTKVKPYACCNEQTKKE